MENERNSVATTSRKEAEGITGWIESVIITVSQTSIGQALFKFIDSFLWVVEKSTQWSLPAHEIAAEENGKVFGRIELVRPLPWLFFLPGLVILRIIRCGLNLGAFILGYPQIRPSGMVKFVQKTRRRLRAINVKAIKARRRITCAKDKRLTMIEAKKALIRSIRLTLSTLSCLDTSKSSPSPPPMKIRVGQMDFDTIATPEEKSTTESVGSPVLHEMKRKFSQILDDESSDGSDNETLRTKLERLAMENSTDDSDFNIADCSMESSTGSSENDVDKEISFNETTEIQREACKFLKDDTYQLMSLKLQIAKSMKDKETKDGGKFEGVDSSESAVEKASNMIKDFVNGEINSALQQSSTVSEPSSAPEDIEEKKTSKETCDTATEACTLQKSDSSPSKQNFSEVCTSPKSRSSPLKGNSSECCASEVSTSPKTRSSPSKESPSKTQTQTEISTLPKSRNSPSKQSCSETPEAITLPKSRNSPSKESCSETSEAITLPKSRDSLSKESCSETSEAIILSESRDSPSKESSETSKAITLSESRDSPSKESSETSEATILAKSRDSPSKESSETSKAITVPKSRDSPSKESSETSKAITVPKSRDSPSKESSETSEATTLPKSRDSPSKESSETSEATTLPKSRDSSSKKSCSETSEASTLPKSRDSPLKKNSSDTRASETSSALSTRRSPSKENYSGGQGKSYYKSKKYGRNKSTWTEQ
ncbi:dentin sialophosphoprotein-like isoform X2 [Apis cerana]|nr:dentin sialophosphoprotein-like isoform X2 [Apis cerana]XP_061935220.1 dentin sialophosphoprotein-like isoform X2 [Apis cerana]XP_061935221.1 dentin sialophosphoprotein-like isoform X2 [Apis cerana]